jgi:flagellar FliL protein
MSTEARVVAPQQKIGARPIRAEASAPDKPPNKAGKKKLILMGGLVAVIALAAAYWFLAGPGKATAATTATGPSATASPAPTYDLGEVLALDSISINLQGGHYLRLGLGLQLIKSVHTPPDKAKALDAAIALFSGHTTEELADPATREDLKKQLGETLFKLYDGEVVSVYYTDFVTQ